MVKWKKLLKKPLCMVLCSAMVVTSGNFTVPGLAGTVKAADKKEVAEEPGGTVPSGSGNILDNPSFDGNTDGWFVTTANEAAKLKYVPEGGQDDIGGCVKVYDRDENWNSLAQDIKNKVKNKTKYNFSCWVKLGDEYKAESIVKAGLTIQSDGDNNGEPVYDGWGIANNTVTASKDEWRQIKGSFMANWNGTLSQLQFKIADENNTNSFYVDNLSITEDKPTENIPDGEPGGNIPEKGTNILDNPSFDGNTDGWFVTTANEAAKLKYVPEGGQDGIGGCVKVYDRDENWNSLAQDIKNKVKNKTKYNFSCWVKLGDEYNAESIVKAGLTIQSDGDNNGVNLFMMAGVLQTIQLQLLRMNGDRLREVLWQTGTVLFHSYSLKLLMKIIQIPFMWIISPLRKMKQIYQYSRISHH